MLQDNFSRKFQYIRLSITERCNFKCEYCLPNGYKKTCNDTSLSINEINNLVAALIELGVWKIRLTGGEPTTRQDLIQIIKTIKSHPEIKQIALTTNGYKLTETIQEYHAAGLTHLNISIDSFTKEQFKQVTGVDKLEYILNSIKVASEIGLEKIKINAVLLPHTLDELNLFTDYIKYKPISVRFIELMQTNDNNQYFNENYINANRLHNILLDTGWKEIPREIGAGPAIEFAHTDYKGTVGIIAPYSKDFCTNCNRLRITHKGELRLCLFGDGNYNLRNLLQSSTQKHELQQAILDALTEKPKEHLLTSLKFGNIKNLSNVGG